MKFEIEYNRNNIYVLINEVYVGYKKDMYDIRNCFATWCTFDRCVQSM